jgi:hypothetical protein
VKERLANFTYLAPRWIKTFQLRLAILRFNLQHIDATFLQISATTREIVRRLATNLRHPMRRFRENLRRFREICGEFTVNLRNNFASLIEGVSKEGNKIGHHDVIKII